MSSYGESVTSPSIAVAAVRTTGLFHRILVPLPHVLLAIGTAFALLTPGQSDLRHLVTVGLAATTALWVLVMHTLRSPSWIARPGPMILFVGVELALAGALMVHQPIFFVFGAVGFVQAHELLPPRWGFACVVATSALVNLVPYGVPTAVEWLAVTICMMLLQIAMIGWFGYLGRRYNEQSEQRRAALAQLESAQAENAGLHAQLVAQAREAGVHDERRRMAREIHDTLAQGLTGIITQLQAADQVREQPERWQLHMDKVKSLARDSLAAARRSVAALGPPELDDARLPDAIAKLAADWSQTSGIPAQVETDGDARPLLAGIEITLFRMAQEALANVAKHSGATRVAVTLSYLDDVVLLDVRDDGTGFPPPTSRGASEPATARGGSEPAAVSGGFGLRAIRQRLELVGGTLAIESAYGEGTALNASVPALTAATAVEAA